MSENVKSLLLVDDDQRFRERLAEALVDRGFEVFTAGNFEEALTAFESHTPEFAVVDMRMPGKSGLELVEAIANKDPNCSIVVLTGFGSIASAVEAVRLGAKDYLTKPADSEQILRALGLTADTGAGISSIQSGATTAEDIPSLSSVEWEHIQRVLREFDGNISRAAQALGIHRRSLQRKLQKAPTAEQSDLS